MRTINDLNAPGFAREPSNHDCQIRLGCSIPTESTDFRCGGQTRMDYSNLSTADRQIDAENTLLHGVMQLR
jgi:hypothetical protein